LVVWENMGSKDREYFNDKAQDSKEVAAKFRAFAVEIRDDLLRNGVEDTKKALDEAATMNFYYKSMEKMQEEKKERQKERREIRAREEAEEAEEFPDYLASRSKVDSRTEKVVFIYRETGVQLTWGDVIREMAKDDDIFGCFFSQAIAYSPFLHFFWECPKMRSLNENFEFVTVKNPKRFAPASRDAFEEVFAAKKKEAENWADVKAIAFENKDGSSQLVAPTQRLNRLEPYGSISLFVRRAPEEQQVAFWRLVFKSLSNRLSSSPNGIWLSTSGLGVPWLHVRLDQKPKYYHTKSYM